MGRTRSGRLLRGYPVKNPTSREVVLHAVVVLTKGDKDRNVHRSAVVVWAWREYPDKFSLYGYPEYPDSGVVFSRLSDLVSCGWLTACGDGFYSTTTAGRRKDRESYKEPIPEVSSPPREERRPELPKLPRSAEDAKRKSEFQQLMLGHPDLLSILDKYSTRK